MKKTLLVLALVGLVAAGCNKTQDQSQNNSDQSAAPAQNAGDQNTTSNNTSSTTPPATMPPPGSQFSGEPGADGANMPQVFAVKITFSGFSPSTITIQKGDYVQFVNNDGSAHWPASNPHPVHTDYPGFDALKGLNTGEKYTFQFMKVGSWGYHDHLNPSWHGTVVVK